MRQPLLQQVLIAFLKCRATFKDMNTLNTAYSDAPTATPDITPHAAPQRTVHAVSLTKAAKELGISTSTLRRAIQEGKLEAEKTDQGNYRIPIDQLAQYQQNELYPREKQAAARISTPKVAQGATRRVDTHDAPVATENMGLTGKSTNEKLLEVENKHLKEQLSMLKESHQDYRKMAEASLRLLPMPQKEGQGDISTPLPKKKTSPLYAVFISVAVVTVLLVGGVVYADKIRELINLV